MKTYEQDWENYRTPPIRQFDLYMAEILDMLSNNKVLEARQYIRGLRDGNRFARERPEIRRIEKTEVKALLDAVKVCRDINDAGEIYNAPNADAAQALANLFDMVD